MPAHATPSESPKALSSFPEPPDGKDTSTVTRNNNFGWKARGDEREVSRNLRRDQKESSGVCRFCNNPLHSKINSNIISIFKPYLNLIKIC